VIAEDPCARSGLAAMLAAYPEIFVQSELAPGEAPAPVDVVVWDLGPSGSPPSPAELGGSAALLALSPDESGARQALRAGARGVLLRTAEAARLRAAVLAVAEGNVVLEPSIAERLLESAAETREPAPRPAGEPALPPRELEVLALMAEGLSNKLIADRLSISDHTAKFHVNAILSKLGAETRTEAVVLAARRGILLL
jgi:two-component system nitrate/nitrite response regulator NarL